MTQVELPVAQEVCPISQALPVLQDSPAVHETQLPPLQTLLVPQEVPFAALLLKVHTDEPVLHDVVPFWQVA